MLAGVTFNSGQIYPSQGQVRLEPQFCGGFNVVGKQMTRNGCKTTIYESYLFLFFLTKLTKYIFYIVAFDPIQIQTRLDPQNNCKHLNFVKDVVAKNDQKW